MAKRLQKLLPYLMVACLTPLPSNTFLLIFLHLKVFVLFFHVQCWALNLHSLSPCDAATAHSASPLSAAVQPVLLVLAGDRPPLVTISCFIFKIWDHIEDNFLKCINYILCFQNLYYSFMLCVFLISLPCSKSWLHPWCH